MSLPHGAPGGDQQAGTDQLSAGGGAQAEEGGDRGPERHEGGAGAEGQVMTSHVKLYNLTLVSCHSCL